MNWNNCGKAESVVQFYKRKNIDKERIYETSIKFGGCGRENVANKSMVEDFTEKFGDDYLEYATVEKADDYFKQCFEKIEGDWYADDMKIDFYIDDDMYMMSGWTERARVIAFIDPIRNHENQFEIGLEAGEMQVL